MASRLRAPNHHDCIDLRNKTSFHQTKHTSPARHVHFRTPAGRHGHGPHTGILDSTHNNHQDTCIGPEGTCNALHSIQRRLPWGTDLASGLVPDLARYCRMKRKGTHLGKGWAGRKRMQEGSSKRCRESTRPRARMGMEHNPQGA